MANAYSIIHNYGNAETAFNTDLIAKVLQYKQGKYDANLAKIDQTLAKLGTLDIAKDEDKQYLNERTNRLLQGINDASLEGGGLDLSSSGLTRQLEAHLGQVYDDNVVTALIETKKIRDYDASVQKMSEKDSKLFNANNYAFGKQAVTEYMNDGKVGSRMNQQLVYSPYVDVNKILMDRGLEIAKAFKGSKITIPQYDTDKDGNKVMSSVKMTKEVNSLTPQDLKQIGMSTITPEMSQQIRIDSWARYGGFKEPKAIQQLQSDFTDYSTRLMDSKQDELSSLKLRIDAAKDENEKKGLEDAKLNLDAEISEFKQLIPRLLDSPLDAAAFMGKQQAVGNMVNSLSTLYSETVTYEKNDIYWAKVDHEHKVSMDAHKWKMDEANLAINKEKLQLDKDKLDLQKMGVLDANGNRTGTSNIGGVNTVVDIVPNEDLGEIEAKLSNEVLTKANTANEYFKKSYAVIEDLATQSGEEGKQAKLVVSEVGKLMKSNPSMTQADALAAVVRAEGTQNLDLWSDPSFNVNGSNMLQDAIILNTESLALDKKLQNIEGKEWDTKSDLYISSKTAIDSFKGNSNIEFMYQDATGKTITESVGNFLTKNNINNTESFKNKKVKFWGKPTSLHKVIEINEHVNKVLNSIPRDKTNSKPITSGIISSMTGYLANFIKGETMSLEHVPKNNIKAIARIAKLLGEDLANVVITTKDSENIVFNKKSKTYNTMQAGVAYGIYDKHGIRDNDFIDDDATIGRFYSEPKSEATLQAEKRLYGKSASGRGLAIKPDSEVGKTIANIISSKGLAEGYVTSGNSFNLKLEGDKFMVYQATKDGGKDITRKGYEMPVEEFLENPELKQLYDNMKYDESKSYLNSETLNGEPLPRRKLFIPDEQGTSTNVVETAVSALQSMGLLSESHFLTKNSSLNHFNRSALVTTMDAINKTEDNPNFKKSTVDIKETIENIYDNNAKFSTDMTAKNGKSIVKLYYDKKLVFTDVQPVDDVSSQYQLQNKAGGVLFGHLLQTMLAREYNNRQNGRDFTKEFKELATLVAPTQ